MNSENFHEYVKNPSMLYQVSYQELKSLVLQYPYSPNLRYLLLLKSIFENSTDFDKNQVLASLSSPDRKKLRQLVKQFSRLRELKENYTLSEDFLELKELSALEGLMQEPVAKEKAPSKGAAVPPPPSVSNLGELDEEMEEVNDLGFLEGLIGGDSSEEEPATSIEAQPQNIVEEPIKSEDLDTTATLEELIEKGADAEIESVTDELEVGEESLPEIVFETDPEIHEVPKPLAATSAEIPLEITNESDLKPAPMPKSSFNAWLRKLNPPQAGILKTELKDISLNSRQLHLPEAEKETSVKQIAEQSVEEDKEIASETLALLLEKQKFYVKAISMYERLSLLFPEKSSLFAAKIEELKKKS